MRKHGFEKTLNLILDEIFGFRVGMNLEDVEKKLTVGIKLPRQVSCSVTAKPLWVVDDGGKFISEEAIMDRARIDDFMLPKKPLDNFEEVLGVWRDIGAVLGEKSLDSQDTLESDNIFASNAIFRSSYIIASKQILFSESLVQCEYVVAGSQSTMSQFCTRVFSSKECTNSFEVSYCAKVRNSFFVHDCADVSDSLFCAHIRSKRFCIANMQFTEEEYRKLKDIILRDVVKKLHAGELPSLLPGR